MTETLFAVEMVATWLNQRGFSEAATYLLRASEEVAMNIDEAGYVNWLYYQAELKEANQSSGVEDDLPF